MNQTERIQQLETALRQVQTALANYRDGVDPVLKLGENGEKELCLEEVKYCVVDPLLENEILGIDDVIGNLSDVLAQCSMMNVAEVANEVCKDQIFVEDEEFRNIDGELVSESKLIDLIGESIAEMPDGVQIANIYNQQCSDQIKYVGDSMFEKIDT